MQTRSRRPALLAAVFAGILVAASVQAGDARRHTNHISFAMPVGLPGVTLAPGTYIFELADSDFSGNIVRVWNRDRSSVFFAGFTHRQPRPSNWPARRPVSLGEAPSGTVPPILVWYPLGESDGYGFTYTERRR